jgi:hypothetical protein
MLLLRDGDSPVFCQRQAHELERAVEAALEALEPSLPD